MKMCLAPQPCSYDDTERGELAHKAKVLLESKTLKDYTSHMKKVEVRGMW